MLTTTPQSSPRSPRGRIQRDDDVSRTEYWCHECGCSVDAFVNGEEELECRQCHGDFVEIYCFSDENEAREEEEEEETNRERRERRDRREDHPSNFVVPVSPPLGPRVSPSSPSDDIRSRTERGIGSPIRRRRPPRTGPPNDMGTTIANLLRGVIPTANQRTPVQVVMRSGIVSGRSNNNIGALTAGDYALGNMDAILNQLFHADASASRRTTSKSFVDNLKCIRVTDEQFAAHLECAVCKDRFNRDEDAHKLPCDHWYHPHCIVPWLKVNCTCPVCRYKLPTDDATSSTSSVTTSGERVDRQDRSSRSGRDVTEQLSQQIGGPASTTRTTHRAESVSHSRFQQRISQQLNDLIRRREQRSRETAVRTEPELSRDDDDDMPSLVSETDEEEN